MGLDTAGIRQDFPILNRRLRGRRLVYLDSAATSQKPRQVIEAVADYYRRYNANVHRGLHTLAEEATGAYEAARERVARFIGAPDPRCIVFTRNCSEAINLVAYAWGRARLKEGDEILLTPMEHHSNLVPWQLVAEQTGARLRFLPLTGDGRLDLSELDRYLTPRTRILALAHVSNVLGTVNPVAELTAAAHRMGAVVLVDGAQGAPHLPVDVSRIGCDFYTFSGHKMLAPMGIGVLYGRLEVLEAMPPFLGGGEMIGEVQLERSTYKEPPWRFEAGTPNVGGAIGLGAAVEYLEGVGMEAIFRHDQELVGYALARLEEEVPGLRVYGPREGRGGLVAFNVPDIHPHDLAQILDEAGVAIRAGHHCTQPLHRHLGVAATARASFYLYNDRDDVDALVGALQHAREFFSHVTH